MFEGPSKLAEVSPNEILVDVSRDGEMSFDEFGEGSTRTELQGEEC